MPIPNSSRRMESTTAWHSCSLALEIEFPGHSIYSSTIEILLTQTIIYNNQRILTAFRQYLREEIHIYHPYLLRVLQREEHFYHQ